MFDNLLQCSFNIPKRLWSDWWWWWLWCDVVWTHGCIVVLYARCHDFNSHTKRFLSVLIPKCHVFQLRTPHTIIPKISVHILYMYIYSYTYTELNVGCINSLYNIYIQYNISFAMLYLWIRRACTVCFPMAIVCALCASVWLCECLLLKVASNGSKCCL